MKTQLTNSFRIKKEYLTNVPTNRRVRLQMSDGTTMEGNAIGSIDHPKFTELRDKLEKLGFIKTERSFWNGDRVLKSFKLNGMPFKPGERFFCACAMGIKLKCKK